VRVISPLRLTLRARWSLGAALLPLLSVAVLPAAARAAGPRALPDPLAVARYLSAQRAGYGTARQAAVRAAAAERRAAELRARPRAAGLSGQLTWGTWAPIGPGPVTNSVYGGTNSGRVDAVAQAPGGEIYVGTAGGGVWSSTDGGRHWSTTTDQVSSGLAIGALAIDPTNPQIIYAGTGEANNCGDCFYGGGVLKSTDGGATWTIENPSGVFSGVDFASLAVDPHNDQHVYAATSAGLFESGDGGTSWAAPTGGGDVSDPASAVVLDPAQNPSTAFVATVGDGVQESTDGGNSFTLLGGGLPSGATVGTTALAIGTPSASYPSADQTIYAAVALEGTTDANGGGLSLFQSTNGGTSWNRLTIPEYTNQLYAFGTGTRDQADFDNALTVDPANPSHVIAGGISAVESTDGGSTWSDLNGHNFFTGTNVLHPDFHAITFAPSGEVLLGSDGGVFGYQPSTPGPAGVSDLNGDLDTALVYEDLGLSSSGSTMLAGLQDNGTVLSAPGQAWPQVASGNGGDSAINPLDSSQQYAESDGALLLTGNAWASATDITPPGEPGSATNFVPPIALAANPGTPDAPTVYYGGGDLWRTTDPAASTPSWTRLTNAGTGVSAIAVAPSNPAVVYAGFDDGTLEVSTNATSASPTFTSIPSGVSEWITHIAVSPADPGQIALTFSASNTHTSALPPMVQTASVALAFTPAATFSDVTGNLPLGVASNSVLYDGDSLVLATDVGVFGTPVAGLSGASTSWSTLSSGLPNVPVLGLSLDASGNLYAATHGRGVWKLPLSASTPPAPAANSAPSVTGTALAGQTLGAVGAGWSGSVSWVTDAWLRCTTTCSPILGADGSTYTLQGADVGATIELSQMATGPGGTSAPAISARFGPIAAAPTPTPSPAPTPTPTPSPTPPPRPTPTPRPPGSGSHPVSAAAVHTALAHLLSAARLPRTGVLLSRGWTLTFTPPAAGRLTVTLIVREHGKTIRVALRSVSAGSRRRLSLHLVLSARGRRLLAHGGRLQLTAVGTFAARGVRPQTAKRTFRL
jgi:hypothetical protein